MTTEISVMYGSEGVKKILPRRPTYRPLGYKSVYLPLCKVADTPCHVQGGDTQIEKKHDT